MGKQPRRVLGSITWLNDAHTHYSLQVSIQDATRKGGRRRITRNGRTAAPSLAARHRAAEEHLAALVAKRGGKPEAACELPLGVWLRDVWVAEGLDEVRARTADGYLSKLNTHVMGDPIALKPIGTVTGTDIQGLLDRRKRAGVSAATRKALLSVVGNALRYAKRRGHIKHDPTENVMPPKHTTPEPDVPDLRAFNLIIDTFRDHIIERHVLIATAGGMRRSENAALTDDDIDLWVDEVALPGGTVALIPRGQVHIKRSLHRDPERKGLRYEAPKSRRSWRTVSLPSWCAGRLLELGPAGGPITPGRGGRPMSPDAISHLYRKTLEDAGVPYFPLRVLRHAHITLMLEAGAPLRGVSGRAGHGSEKVTEERYVDFRDVWGDELAGYAEKLRLPSPAENGPSEGREGNALTP